jgi:hypothetical protein
MKAAKRCAERLFMVVLLIVTALVIAAVTFWAVAWVMTEGTP